MIKKSQTNIIKGNHTRGFPFPFLKLSKQTAPLKELVWLSDDCIHEESLKELVGAHE